MLSKGKLCDTWLALCCNKATTTTLEVVGAAMMRRKQRRQQFEKNDYLRVYLSKHKSILILHQGMCIQILPIMTKYANLKR
jgi:hypothetical protein